MYFQAGNFDIKLAFSRFVFCNDFGRAPLHFCQRTTASRKAKRKKTYLVFLQSKSLEYVHSQTYHT